MHLMQSLGHLNVPGASTTDVYGRAVAGTGTTHEVTLVPGQAKPSETDRHGQRIDRVFIVINPPVQPTEDCTITHGAVVWSIVAPPTHIEHPLDPTSHNRWRVLARRAG